MPRTLFAVLALAVAAAGSAEAQARLTLGQLMVRYRAAKNTVKPSGEIAEKLAEIERRGLQAFRDGRSGEFRKLIAEANATLRSEPWSEAEAFAASLALRTDQSVADPGQTFIGRLTQSFPAPPANGPLSLRLALYQRRAGRVARPGAKVRDAAFVEHLPSDLIDEPAAFAADFSSVPDGVYLLGGEVRSNDELIARVALPIQLARGISTQKTAVESRLEGLDVRPDTQASILFPFNFARRANLGEMGPERLDLAEALAESERILAAVEQDRDPLYQATGELKRHYLFEEAGAIMPYRLYVPSSYEPGKPHPLILGLHGQGGSESTFFNRDDGLLKELAEERGYIVATVLGYSPTGGYGAQANNADPRRAQESRWSEQDTMNVLERVLDEYDVDRGRVFLMGHSMGGNGTWVLGSKYAERWAAIAPIAGGQTPTRAMIQRLAETPVLVAHGDADVVTSVDASRRAAELMDELGVEHRLLIAPGESHSSIVPIAWKAMFEFFDQVGR